MSVIGSLNIVLAAQTAGFTKGLKTAQGSMHSFAASAKPLLGLLGVSLGGAGLALGLKKIVTTGAEFEHQMQAVKAVSGATGAEFDALTNEAARLGSKTQFTAKQAGEGMEILAQAGLDTGTILTAMEPTLNLAAAGAVGIAEAAEVAVTAMRGMGIGADGLQATVDILAKASSASNADISGLGEALKAAGPMAAAAGKDIYETVAAVEAFSNVGIKGEEAGSAVSRIMAKLASQTPEAEKALKSLGVKTLDASGDIRPLADIVDDLNAKMAGMGTGKKLDKLTTIFELQGAKSFAALMGQGGDALRKFEAELHNASGEAAKQAETRMDSLAGSWEKFGGAVDGVMISIYRSSAGLGARPLVDFATSAVDAFNTSLPKLSEIVSQVFARIQQALGGRLAAIGGMVTSGWAAIGNVLSQAGPIWFDNALRQFTMLADAIGEMMAPIVDAVRTHWATAAQVFMDLYPQILNVVTALFGAALDMVVTGWNGIVAAFEWAGGLIFSLVQSVFGDVFGEASLSMSGFVETLQAGLVVLEFGFTHWKDVLAIAGLAATASIVTLGNQIAYVLTEVIPAVLRWFGDNWRDILFTVFDWTTTVFINLGQNIRNAMAEIWDFIASGGTNKLELAWTPLTEGFVNTVRALPQIAEREMGAIEKALYDDILRRERQLSQDFGTFTAQRGEEFSQRQKAAHAPKAPAAPKAPEAPETPPAPKAPEAPKLPEAPQAPAGVGESKRPKALEQGTAEAFHAAFGGKDPALSEAKKQTMLQTKQQRDIQRMKELAEKNQVQAVPGL